MLVAIEEIRERSWCG